MMFVLFLLLAPVMAQVAQPYEINPAKWVFYQREEYEMKPIFFNFQIKNTQNGTIVVSLKTIPPEYLYSDQYPGIQAFPDYSWITISEAEVTIPAGQTVEVPVYVNIPEQYYLNGSSSTAVSNYNKSYEAWFLADQTEGPGNIQVDYRCRWVFLTPPKYVPPWERPGQLPIPYFVYYLVIIIVAVLVVCIILIKRRGRGSRSGSKRHTKKDDDFFM
jgi:hypothetical protein